jgi:hypothetical protein
VVDLAGIGIPGMGDAKHVTARGLLYVKPVVVKGSYRIRFINLMNYISEE